MNSLQKTVYVIIIAIIPSMIYSQKIIQSFGNNSFCKIDSSTLQIFISTDKQDEGISFIIDGSGKICSSGKVSEIKDYETMKLNLSDLKESNKISLETYNQILCSIEKEKEVKLYYESNSQNIKQEAVLEILDRECN